MDSLVLFCTGALLVGGLFWFICFVVPTKLKGKSALSLSGGSIPAENVQDNFKQYLSYFRSPKELKKADNVPEFVDKYFNLVTDIYEWVWGESFHFAPSIPGKSKREAMRAHELRAADLIEAKPGEKILDVGCGIGGPMREIASHSRAKVVGITINEYQVNRARFHNKKAGLDSLCEVVCGNFLHMPFPDNSFDGAYSIEGTSYAPKLEEVYAEVFRVLKPGSLYMTYEEVTTEKYNASDAEHLDIIEKIEIAYGLPGLRSYSDITKTARKVGFKVLKEQDVAKPPAGPWWSALKMGRMVHWRDHFLVWILAAIRIVPKGTVDVHAMLAQGAGYMIRSAELGIFTPMHMVLLRKPAAASS